MLDSFTVFVLGVVIIVIATILALGYFVDRGIKRSDTRLAPPQPWNGYFLVVPGPVISAHDGQEHYVPAHNLIRLYGVDARKCVIILPGERWPVHYDRFIILEPRADGDYDLLSALAESNLVIALDSQTFEVYA